MCKFMFGLVKLFLVLLVVVVIGYLLTFPPEHRGRKLREVGLETLDGIENLAGMGRDVLSGQATEEEATGGESLSDSDNPDFFSSQERKRTIRSVLPPDFRQELADAVQRLNVVTITERWQAVEHSALKHRKDVDSRSRLVHEAVSLAILFRRDTWHVAGRAVPSDQLENYLVDYANQ